MRRKGTFPTKADWLGRREPGSLESHEEEQQAENHEGAEEPRLPDRPVITIAPKRRGYWR